jgi:hypothetical protein
MPVVTCVADDPETQLILEPESWVHKWDNTQAGGEVCQFKMWVAGPPGPVRVVVRCVSGPASRLLLFHCCSKGTSYVVGSQHVIRALLLASARQVARTVLSFYLAVMQGSSW